MITSTSNARIKNLIQLKRKGKERDRQGLFLAEGVKMLLEAPPERMEQVLLSESFLNKYKKDPEVAGTLESMPAETVEIVSDPVFSYLSDTQSPQGALCVLRQYHYEPEALLGAGARGDTGEKHSRGDTGAGPGRAAAGTAGGNTETGPALCMVLEHLQDPGNLGTILRAGEGAGVTGILMSADCVDIYNPKVIRSTMGSIYRVPFAYTEDLAETLTQWKHSGVRLYAAHLEGRHSYDKASYQGDSAFLIGNESRGLTEKTAALADERIRIPMLGQVESLNAAIASALLMYEAARQRRAVI